jgi:hypothetical protein
MMYVLYKLVNNLAFTLFSKRLDFPALFSKKSISAPYEYICFDFDHRTTHLGDKLFFLKVIRLLRLHGTSVRVLDRSGTFDMIYELLYSESSPTFHYPKSKECLRVVPKPAFLSKLFQYKNFLIVDLTDIRINKRLPEQLVYSLANFFGVELSYNLDFRFSVKESSRFDKEHNRVAIFNNYIDSGKFRKIFLRESLLRKQCIRLKNDGYTIVHIGTANDKNSDKKKYSFVDLDLRGCLTVVDLIKLLGSCEVNVLVSYDSFIMHLGCIFGKPLFVLFRGRFSYSQRQHHFSFVNNSFESFPGQITYLFN